MIKIELDDDVAQWLKRLLEAYLSLEECRIWMPSSMQQKLNAQLIIGKIIQNNIENKK
jgi:hypothetical protein